MFEQVGQSFGNYFRHTGVDEGLFVKVFILFRSRNVVLSVLFCFVREMSCCRFYCVSFEKYRAVGLILFRSRNVVLSRRFA